MNTSKNVSIMCFHDELCQAFNAMMTALSLLACPLNIPLFGMSERDLIDGAKIADPARYYKERVMHADMSLAF